MRTTVFAYKKVIGIQSDVKAEGLINDPTQPGQLGFIINAKFVDISPEALILLKKIKKSRDAIGDVMADSFGEEVTFSFLGGPLGFLSRKSEADRDYKPNLLSSTEGVIIPDNFKEFIDNLETEGKLEQFQL
jgi:hypothetical protein